MKISIKKLSAPILALNMVICCMTLFAFGETATAETSSPTPPALPTPVQSSGPAASAPPPTAKPTTPAVSPSPTATLPPTAQPTPAPTVLPTPQPPLEPTLQTAFPDPGFRSYIKELLGDPALPDDAPMTEEYKLQLNTVAKNSELLVSSRGIHDLSGLEYFPELQVLYCDQNNLTSLDLSVVPKLTYLNCHSNNLISLDVSMLPELENLVCSENQLTQLDLSHNPKLLKSTCESNQIRVLDLSNNPELLGFNCAQNNLESLDVSQNSKLGDLSCPYNNLTTLDVRNNPELVELYCHDNQLSSLDVSTNQSLRYFSCSNNRLKTLDVSQNTELWSLWADNNCLSSLILKKEGQLPALACDGNNLAELDLSNAVPREEVEYFYQKLFLPIQETENGYQVTLPVSSPGKVSIIEKDGIIYDPVTGIVQMKEPISFKYTLDTGDPSHPFKVKVITQAAALNETEFSIDSQTQTLDIDVTALSKPSIAGSAQLITSGEDTSLHQINGMKSISLDQLTKSQKVKIFLWKDLNSMEPLSPSLNLS